MKRIIGSVFENIFESTAPNHFDNGFRSELSNGRNCWFYNGCWIVKDTYEEAKLFFERYQKLKAFWE